MSVQPDITSVATRPAPKHKAKLESLRSQADKIRYACEQVPQPTTAAVRAWLALYKVRPDRSHLSSVVSAWRKQNGIGSTGELIKLTPEMIAELDAITTDTPAPQLAPAVGKPEETQVLAPVRKPQETPQTVPVEQPVAIQKPSAAPDKPQKRFSTWVFLLGALVGLVVSVDTSWRFFGDKLGVTNVPERIAMFAGMEIVLVACGIAMFEGVRRRGGTPGPARWLAWALCGASAYAALVLSGPFLGAARVIFGPVLSVVALHFALGVELRARGYQRTGTLARIGRELRERFLSRFGLADDDRDALTRTRDRAARRVARLALAPKWTLLRKSRLDRNMRKSNVAHDADARDRMLAELAAIRHARDLRTLDQQSPWQG
ncbi:hypothetical protein LWC34_24295 [Kibdelosporangium philippinense]|uniref:DUF2637 domain-containing protein n=1 Tax=Kibdelosporangium philippinense TaxID=211113 RepID=A0ABS8ZDL4_9PSEU|nr:hypothetical protein [Kibdelosporangium philippinense]MCE7005926.1 hypothetical protein [Kibdelosporangium philippinense]